jgi:heptaprenyl diphosphate synthase
MPFVRIAMKKTPWDSMPVMKAEIDALEVLLEEEFKAIGFIQQAASRLVLGGGKRLRPALVIAAAQTGAYDRARVLPVAAALEALHTATLVHDDVIDGADTRRGMPTLHGNHGNHVAIYAGDYLLAKAVMLLSRSDLPPTELHRLDAAMESMCTGEVAQYLGRNRVPGYREYLKRIMGKTGILFAAACAAGGRSAGLDDRLTMRLWRFGMRLAAAFQMRDDLLDIEGAGSGKTPGRDLSDGIVTLPVLLAAANDDYRRMLSRFFSGGSTAEGARELLETAGRMGMMEKTRQLLSAEIDRGLELLGLLPDSPGRDMLGGIARMIG